LWHLGPIIPKYYYVSRDGVDAEKANPGSEDRLASNEDAEQGNIFLWGQSVYIISQLLSVFSLSLSLSLVMNNVKILPHNSMVARRMLWPYIYQFIRHTHTCLTALLLGTIRVSRYQKGKNQSGFY